MHKRPGGSATTANDEILTAALDAFATHGSEACSIRLLDRGLGISHSANHQRFGTKEALWFAAIDQGFQRILNALVPHLGADVDPAPKMTYSSCVQSLRPS